MKVRVKCIKHYYDLELKQDKYESEEYTVEKTRAEHLLEHNVVEIIGIEEEVAIPKPTATIKVKKYKRRSDK